MVMRRPHVQALPGIFLGVRGNTGCVHCGKPTAGGKSSGRYSKCIVS